LSIVAAIATAHDVDLVLILRLAGGGLTVHLMFPVPAAALRAASRWLPVRARQFLLDVAKEHTGHCAHGLRAGAAVIEVVPGIEEDPGCYVRECWGTGVSRLGCRWGPG
jgi:hypothetical protein